MRYSKERIEQKVKDSLSKKETQTLYKQEFINYTSKTTDSKVYCSEIIANALLNEVIVGKMNIEILARQSKSYFTKSHQNRPVLIKDTNREEEKCAKRLFNQKDLNIGEVIDFQIPLKDKQSDRLGKIDLMIYDKKTSTLYLIELKYGKNTETLLRGILEIYTYDKVIDKIKLQNDFGLKEIKKIQPAVMVIGSSCNSYKELEDIENRPELLKLAKKLGITFFKSDDEVNFEIVNSEKI